MPILLDLWSNLLYGFRLSFSFHAVSLFPLSCHDSDVSSNLHRFFSPLAFSRVLWSLHLPLKLRLPPWLFRWPHCQADSKGLFLALCSSLVPLSNFWLSSRQFLFHLLCPTLLSLSRVFFTWINIIFSLGFETQENLILTFSGRTKWHIVLYIPHPKLFTVSNYFYTNYNSQILSLRTEL